MSEVIDVGLKREREEGDGERKERGGGKRRGRVKRERSEREVWKIKYIGDSTQELERERGERDLS